MEAEMFLVLGGAMGLTTSASITELSASSKTSRGLFGLNSRGVSKSTLPESTRESLLLTFDTAPPLVDAMRRRVGVGVSRFPEILSDSSGSSHACWGSCKKKGSSKFYIRSSLWRKFFIAVLRHERRRAEEHSRAAAAEIYAKGFASWKEGKGSEKQVF